MWKVLLFMLAHVVMKTLGNRTALIIIDVQDCFLPGGSQPVKDGNDVIPVINNIRNKYESYFSLVVFSQDWHCADHVSFASQHLGKNPYEYVTLQYDKNGKLCYGTSVPMSFPHAHNCSEVSYNVTQRLWPDHCIENVTSGPTSSRIDPALTRNDNDSIIYKGNNCEVDSYSAFYDNGGFRQTRLESVLKSHGIDTVFVTGLALDYCVYFTSLDAQKLGYNTFTVEDASRGIDADSTAAAVAKLTEKGVKVIQSSSLETYLAVNSAPCRYQSWTISVLTSAVVVNLIRR